MKKILLYIIAVIAVLIVGLLIFITIFWDKDYDAPFPDIKASTDPALIERGKYLCYGPAHCATCHVPMDKILEVENGLEIPLSGGWELELDPGIFRAGNLTPDMETGIGKYTDGELARAMRHSVGHDNKFLMPFMPYQGLSDEDLIAIISFLRSQKSVKSIIEPREVSFLGKALLALGIVLPEGPKETPPKSLKKDSSISYGSYIAYSVANCFGCHTERDLKTGKHIGTAFAGGMIFMPEAFSKGWGFISTNITPDEKTGSMVDWSEEEFIERFREKRLYDYTPMPWGAYSRMEDIELKALYRFLNSLEPVDKQIEQIVFEPGEEIPF